MKSRTWKVSIALVSVLIVLMFVINSEFYGVEVNGELKTGEYLSNGSGNGTMILVEVAPGANARINASFGFTGTANGPGTIYLLDGHYVTLNNSNPGASLSASVTGRHYFSGTQSISEYGINLSKSGKSLGIAVVKNFQFRDFNTTYLSSVLGGTSYYAIFIENAAIYDVKAVAMPL